jgi:hypothetical protein
MATSSASASADAAPHERERREEHQGIGVRDDLLDALDGPLRARDVAPHASDVRGEREEPLDLGIGAHPLAHARRHEDGDVELLEAAVLEIVEERRIRLAARDHGAQLLVGGLDLGERAREGCLRRGHAGEAQVEVRDDELQLGGLGAVGARGAAAVRTRRAPSRTA